MTTQEAIEILTKCHGHSGIAHNKHYITAQKLGIKALEEKLKAEKELPL